MDTLGDLGLWSALVAGLAASGHCASMCGGVAGALAVRAQQATGASRFGMALAYNLARITSYAMAGAIVGTLGHLVLHAFDIALLVVVFRVLAGLIMLAVAGRLLFGWRVLDPLEAGGSKLWRRVLPWAGQQGRRGGLGGAIGLGLAWGWLPCGMTYSMLMLAGMTGGAAAGAAVMLAFGVGTLPSMVTATVAFERIATLLVRRAALRNVAGVLLLAFGLWTAGDAIYMRVAGGGHAHHHLNAH